MALEVNSMLQVIKKMDPCTTGILARVKKVTLFMFCGQTGKWKESNIEGEFVVCSRSREPFNTIHILSKFKKNNFMEPIVEDWDWKTEDMLLLYRKGQNIFGIRFYNEDEYFQIATLVETIMKALKQNKSFKTPSAEKSGVNIINILSQAQEDFQKVAGIIEQQLYQAAVQRPGTSQMPQMPQVPQMLQMPQIPQMHQMLQMPQMSQMHQMPQMLQMPQMTPIPQMPQVMPQVHQITQMTEMHQLAQVLEDDDTSSDDSSSTPSTVKALSPASSVSTVIEVDKIVEEAPDEKLAHLTSLLSLLDKPVLITPEMFEKKSKEENQIQINRSVETPEPLNQKQMIQAMIYLLKNDTDFVTKLHEAYIKSFLELLE